MSIRLPKKIKDTNVKNVKHHNFHFIIGCMLLTAFLFMSFQEDTAMAASGLKIYNYTTENASTYNDKQIAVTLNGMTITKPQTPGILVNGIALVPYSDVYERSAISADCIYDKSNSTISISKYGITVLMTIGSKKAMVNGVPAMMQAAPMKIKYKNANIVKVLVPSRFVSEALGLGYTWYSTRNIVAIEKNTMLLSYNNADAFEYIGMQGQVTINGKQVDLSGMPSIITNNTAMLRAKKVFSHPSIGANYSFNPTDQTVTLAKGDKVLTMTIGSKIAYLNNNPMTMDTAPMLVTNCETDTSFVMVPGGFTASCLGYNYTWNKAKKTSMITSQKDPSIGSNNNNHSNNAAPELGGSGVTLDQGTLLGKWDGNPSLFISSSKLHEINQESSEEVASGMISIVSRDYNNIKANSETFMFVSNTPFDKVTSSKAEKAININVDGLTCTNTTYQMYGITSNYINTIGTYNNSEANGTAIEFDMLPDNFTYDISLSADRYILYVTVYLNTVTQAMIGTNASGDYLTLTAHDSMKANILEQSGLFYIDLPYELNSLGDITTEITGSKFIKQFYMFSYPNKTQIILSLNPGYEYYTFEEGNRSTFVFQTIGTQQTDTSTSEEPKEDLYVSATQIIPELTAPVDRSKYEIVIPKPEGLTNAMISHTDYYFNHKFVITMAGDYSGFFNTNSITQNGSSIKEVNTTLSTEGLTQIMVTTTKLQGYEVAADSSNIYINIGNPRDIYKNIVLLDPGHGGAAKGAQYSGYNEKDLNFRILYTLGRKYFDSDTSKLKVYYTRVSDVDMGLSERAAFTEKVFADLFVSLHMNASKATDAAGTEVFYSNKNNSPNKAGLTSSNMAKIFVDNVAAALGTANRGVKQEMYTVVHKNTVPAVLIELGFMSNQSDVAKLTNESFQDNTAKIIYKTLLEVFEDYPTGR